MKKRPDKRGGPRRLRVGLPFHYARRNGPNRVDFESGRLPHLHPDDLLYGCGFVLRVPGGFDAHLHLVGLALFQALLDGDIELVGLAVLHVLLDGHLDPLVAGLGGHLALGGFNRDGLLDLGRLGSLGLNGFLCLDL